MSTILDFYLKFLKNGNWSVQFEHQIEIIEFRGNININKFNEWGMCTLGRKVAHFYDEICPSLI